MTTNTTNTTNTTTDTITMTMMTTTNAMNLLTRSGLAASALTLVLSGTLLSVGCNKDTTRVCSPSNTWSQPVFDCATGEAMPEPEPEPEPEPIAEPEPEPEPAKAVLRGDKIEILEKVQFATASADILDGSFELLDEVARILTENPQVTKLRVEGHTDSRGGKRMNRRLSQKRADAVRGYLVDKGVETERLTSKGFGPEKPIADNKTEDGRATNRRVEFNIVEGGAGVEDSN